MSPARHAGAVLAGVAAGGLTGWALWSLVVAPTLWRLAWAWRLVAWHDLAGALGIYAAAVALLISNAVTAVVVGGATCRLLTGKRVPA